MTVRQIPDPSLDGTVWGTSNLLRLNPDIRFFYCDRRRPCTPSHVWWDGVAFAVDPAVFHRQPEHTLRSDDYVRISFGPLELVVDGSSSLTLEDLERDQAAVRSAAEPTKEKR